MISKGTLFKIMSALLPVFLLIGIELILRLVGAGFSTDLFLPDPDHSDYLVMNTDISKKYFPVRENATIGNREPFKARKGGRTKRFFVLGASTAIGFPYMHNGSFSRMLKYKLQFKYPRYDIEIINLSLTAVNTFTLLDFSRKLLPYKPDGVIIYCGQNEYYGALGAGTGSAGVGVKRLLVTAMESRLVQLLSLTVSPLRKRTDYVTDATKTLMERMARHVEIPEGSQAYEAGIRQFRRNLGSILKRFARNKIPVYLCTVVSNLKDQPPLDRNAAAMEAFQRGLQALSEGRTAEAAEAFIRAKNLDAIRFRAPEEINAVIREYAAGDPNVRLIDAERIFRAHEPDGIPGTELLLEHVHPNLEGHMLLADACEKALSRTVFQAARDTTGFPVNLRTDYPLTALDSNFCRISICTLKTLWPFNEPEAPDDSDTTDFGFITAARVFYKKINWGQGMQRLNNHYMQAGDYGKALKVVEQMCLELPYSKEFFKSAENLSYGLGQLRKSDYYGRKAR